jgi:hypothetical protein
MEQAMESIDNMLGNQATLRRQDALMEIAKAKLPAMLALQIPVWFALLMAALILSLPTPKPNPLPYVAGMLGFAIVWVGVLVARVNRRLDAVVKLVTQDAK